ncbi:hypothetical protein EJB05_28658, partial [Eragrostis curvula]
MHRGRNGPVPPAAGGQMNALPDCVLEHILGFLPAAEAVQTCVLARRWRHLWKSATSLHIGDVGEPVRKLREFVYHLLLLRRGAPLEVCDFYFDGFDEKDVPRVNLWFRYAVACNVRLLSLNALPPEGSGRRFLQLEDLPLVSQKLRILDLKFVRVNSTFLDFSGCPALKHLQFEFSEFSLSSETMTTISSESLEHLSIVDSEFSDGSERSRIRIRTPNLLSLRLEHFQGKTPMLVSNMPSLAEASVRIDDNCDDSCKKLLDPNNLDCDCESCGSSNNSSHVGLGCVLLLGLSAAKCLELTSTRPMFIFQRDLRWYPMFSKLRTLTLNEYWCVSNDIGALACILERSPVLEKLTLHLFSEVYGHKIEMKGRFNSMERSSVISDHLEEVIIKCDVVDERILKVLKFLCAFNICKQIRNSTCVSLFLTCAVCNNLHLGEIKVR